MTVCHFVFSVSSMRGSQLPKAIFYIINLNKPLHYAAAPICIAIEYNNLFSSNSVLA